MCVELRAANSRVVVVVVDVENNYELRMLCGPLDHDGGARRGFRKVSRHRANI